MSNTVAKVVLSAGHYHVNHRVPALVAVEQGFFAEEGLPEVEVIATGNDEKTLAGLAVNAIQFGLDPKPSAVVQASAAGQDVYIIGGWRNQSNHLFITDGDIQNIHDLKGKRIGVREVTGCIGGRQIFLFLAKHGLNPDTDVEFVKAPGSSIHLHAPHLEAGDYSACVISSQHKKEALAKGYNVQATFGEFYPGGYPDRVLATNGAMIRDNPAVVESFLRGIIRAYRYIRTPGNHEEALKVIERSGIDPGPDEDLEKWYTRERLPGIIFPLNGSCPVVGLATVIDQEKEQGTIPTDFTVERVLRPEFVERANKTLDARPETADELRRLQASLRQLGWWRQGVEY